LLKDNVVFVARLILYHRDDAIRANKAGEIINMAVGVVADDPATEPEHFLHAEVVGEDALIRGAIERWIAFLRLAQQAFFGRQQDSFAVHINAATFEHDSMSIQLRLPEWELVSFSN